MKKHIIIIVFLLFFLPMTVLAEDDISIVEVKVKQKEPTSLNANISFDNMNTNITGSLQYQNQYFIYSIEVENNSDFDYRIYPSIEQNDYLSWEYTYDELLEAHTRQTVFITLRYEELYPSVDVYNANEYIVDGVNYIGFAKIVPPDPGVQNGDGSEVGAGDNSSSGNNENENNNQNGSSTNTSDNENSNTDNWTNNPSTGEHLVALFFSLCLVVITAYLLKNKATRGYFIFIIFAFTLFYPFIINAEGEDDFEEDDIVIELSYSIRILKQYFRVEIKHSNCYYGGVTTTYCVKEIHGQTVTQALAECNHAGLLSVDFRPKQGSTFSASGDSLVMNEDEGTYVYSYCTCLSGECEVEVYDKKKKKKKKKKLKDVTPDDLLLVWDFDKGVYGYAKPIFIKELEKVLNHMLIEFDDGSFLDIVGKHKIYNCDVNCFTDVNDDIKTPIGTKTIRSDGKVITVVNKTIINDLVVSCCVITDKHFNVFVNGILTSITLNNMYPIKDMKFIKNNNKVFTREELNTDDYYYDNLRLNELPIDFKGSEKETKKFIEHYVERMKKQNIISIK